MPGVALAKAGGPASQAAASPDAKCTLSPSMDYSGGDFAGCISVGAKLSATPAVGASTTLTIKVKAARSEPDVRVMVDLPANFAFADGTATAAAVSGSGAVARAQLGSFALSAGSTRTITRQVKAVRAGFGEIAVSAADRHSAARTDGGAESVFATVGSTTATSYASGGAAVTAQPTHSTVALALPRGGPERLSTAPQRVAPVSVTGQLHPAVIRPQTAGTSCVSGTWNYVDQTGVSRPAANTLIEALNSSNTLLSYAVSGGDGSYTICWSTGGATTSVYVKFLESNNIWRVTDNSNNVYSFSTGITAVADGTTYSFGNLYPGSSSYYPGLHAFAIANDEWQWVHQYYGGQCWSPFETSCLQLTIHWQSDSTTGTYWNTSGVYLLAGSPDSVDEVAHEIGHNLMWELYGQNFPATTNCNPHYLFTASSTTCGWTEGWADWVATSVYNNMTWTFNGGSTTSFDVTWNEGLGYDTGDQVEGRIVEAMRSLTDGVKGPWDNDPGEGAGVRDNRNFFAALNTYHPNTFADFWADRAALGQDTGQTALSALYEGTIDYGFRNPLSDYVGVHFPEAVPAHNYSHTTTTGYWSVVAERPDAGTDTDLTVYNDFGQTSALASSSYGGTTTDFVAINSNSGHRALQTYYPRVTQFAGSGGYTIEEAQGSNTLSAGSSTNNFTSGQPIRIWDSYQASGQPVYLRAVPTAGQDVQLAIASSSLDFASRSATTSGADPGLGVPATLVYTPTDTGWHGLILLDNSLTSGAVTVFADTTAPIGTVAIDGGAASTANPHATLTLSANDTQTGMSSMQISTDGVFDTEPVLPYATSAPVTLPGSNGTKTVYVRYQNNAGMWSDAVTATISLAAPVPSVTALSPTSGKTAGGNTVTITGTGFTGASAVTFGTVAATSFSVVNSTKITAVAPAQAAAKHNVYVTGPGGTNAAAAGNRYTYVNAPAVTAVSPASGKTAGGNTVTITGTDLTGATAVKFGTVAATSFTVVNAAKITAVVPAQAAASHNVYVTTPYGTSVAATGNKYTYLNAPTVTAVSPSSGKTAGGNTITVTGTGFTSVSGVKIGTVAVTSFTVVSSTKITAVVPAQAAASHNVYVTTPGGVSVATTANRYTYLDVPTVTAVSPSSGPAAGGNTITITGTGFTSVSGVKIGTVAVTSFTVVSSTKITAVVPAQAAAAHNVYVTTPGGVSVAATANRYTYT
ncbi:IPT/TIG domain-containing protein [Jatrophihabitans sp.]|uniref:IPT/TIG domain-containing protein n=1 Tax=Jatrophihabitans sp. TaxID=1932789 RepID=UPI0030C77904